MIKILNIVGLIMLLQSCTLLPESFKENVLKPMNLWKPRPYGMGSAPEGGPPEYTQGWNDGCDSGLAAYGSSHYRGLGHKFKMDYAMINNKDYYQAWHDAYTYCRWYVWNFNRKGTESWLMF